MTSFADLGLSPKLLKALEKTTLKDPTPIQVQAIPHIMKGKDLMGLAQTGTGKPPRLVCPCCTASSTLAIRPARAACGR